MYTSINRRLRKEAEPKNVGCQPEEYSPHMVRDVYKKEVRSIES